MLARPAPGRKRCTVTLSIRIPEDVDRVLREESDREGITVNSLINRALSRYAEWDRYVDKIQGMMIPRHNFALLLNQLDDQKLVEAGRRFAQYRADMISFWWDHISLDTTLKYIMLYFERSNVVRFDVRSEGARSTVVGYHDLGLKGSILIKTIIEELFNRAGKRVEVDVEENHISFRLTI